MDSGHEPEDKESTFSEVVARKQARKLWARRHRHESLWFGLGMFGLVGWSVALPALIGTALGVWLDSRFSGRFSWTLMLMVGGLVIGCLNAWYWIERENSIIQQERQQEQDEEEQEEAADE